MLWKEEGGCLLAAAIIQEKRWTGQSAKEVGNVYKLFCIGDIKGKNGTGVIQCGDWKKKVVEVKTL